MYHVKLSVVVPCYNGGDTIGVQLEALAKQRWVEPWEVIVVDNKSTDRSMEIVELYRKQLANLRVVEAFARQGQPYAVNVGVSAAIGDSVAFCDADDEVASGWVPAMGEALSEHDFVACGIDTQKLNPPWIYHALGDHPQREGLPIINYPPYLPHAGGGYFGVRRSIFEAMGGFDESLPYLHDTDFCFRLQLAGVKLHFVPDAVSHRRYRHKLSGLFDQARHYAEYNVKLYKKYQMISHQRLPNPWKRHFYRWRRVFGRIWRVRRKEDCAKLMWNLGWQIGLLEGSIKHRVPPV